MKIIFFGTPNYVLPILSDLHKSFKGKDGKSPIAAVVTQRPKPSGRKRLLAYSPVDSWAHERKIPVYFKAKDLLNSNVKGDLGILAAYGEIIPDEVLKSFPHGILNIHPSLLPKYRGASPVQATILSGDSETGVSIIKLDSKLDHGPIVSQFRESVNPNDTSDTLRERLFNISVPALTNLIKPYLVGKLKLKEQIDENISYTTLLKKDHGFIPLEYFEENSSQDWAIPFVKDFTLKTTPQNLERFIRAMQPWPVAWTKININGKEKRLKILNAHLVNKKLVIDNIQIEGKNPVSWKQFKEAFGDVLKTV